jgi:ABC-type multidrug transport system ATPase subunit
VRELDADALLERVGLETRGRDRVAGYSKGMRQRLMIARALVNDPDVLILDEPSDGLDPVSAQAIRGVIRDQAERGCAVLLTTHDMWEADALSDRVAFIHEGRIYALDTPERLKLSHGQRSAGCGVRVADGEVDERVVELDGEGTGRRLAEATRGGEVLTDPHRRGDARGRVRPDDGPRADVSRLAPSRAAIVAAIVRKDLLEFSRDRLWVALTTVTLALFARCSG